MKEQFIESWNNMLDKLEGWLNLMVINLPNALLAFSAFVVMYFLSQRVRIWIEKPLRKVIRQVSIRSLVSTTISGLVILFGLFLALSVLNLEKTISSLLAGAGVAGLAIGLALQGTLANTFSGILLSIKNSINIGDYIETNDYAGKVEEITLRHIKIKESDNNYVFIPNKLVVDKPFKNYGLTSRIRTLVKCGISYDSDLEQVRELVIDCIKNKFPQKNHENIEFHYLEFGDSSINFQVRFWVEAKYNLTLLEAKSEAIILLKKQFDKANIDIPFPVRTLNFNTKDDKVSQPDPDPREILTSTFMRNHYEGPRRNTFSQNHNGKLIPLS